LRRRLASDIVGEEFCLSEVDQRNAFITFLSAHGAGVRWTLSCLKDKRCRDWFVEQFALVILVIANFAVPSLTFSKSSVTPNSCDVAVVTCNAVGNDEGFCCEGR
jgi:hypothetical protein